MNHYLLRFDSFAARKDDPALFSRWLFSCSLVDGPRGVGGMRFLCPLCANATRMPDREGVEDLREGIARACVHAWPCSGRLSKSRTGYT